MKIKFINIYRFVFILLIFIHGLNNHVFAQSLPGYFLLKGEKKQNSCKIERIDSQGIHWTKSNGGKTQITSLDKVREGYLYVKPPVEYARALKLFNLGKYDEAANLFGSVAKSYLNKFNGTKNNFSNVAIVYQARSLLNSGKVDEVSEIVRGLNEKHFTEEYHKEISIYKIWELYKTNKWQRIIDKANEIKTKLLPEEEAYLGYIVGLANSNLFIEEDTNKYLSQTLLGFAKVYSLASDKNSKMVKDSINKSIELIKNSKNLSKNFTFKNQLSSLEKLASILSE